MNKSMTESEKKEIESCEMTNMLNSIAIILIDAVLILHMMG